jgi:hypothetical protein
MMEMEWLAPLDLSHSIHLLPHYTPTLVVNALPSLIFITLIEIVKFSFCITQRLMLLGVEFLS